MTELILTTPEALTDMILRALKDFQAQQGQTPQSDWMALKQASAHLSIPEGTIRDWVANRKIPFKKAGGRLLFSRRALDEWVNGE